MSARQPARDLPNPHTGRGRPTDEFARHVHRALAHLHDPGYLQTLPLKPQVSRAVIAGSSWRSPNLGALLQQSLLQAVDSLRPSTSAPAQARQSRYYELLTLRYVEALDIDVVCDRLGVGRAEFFREHRPAIAAVTSILRESWTLAVDLSRAATDGHRLAALPVPYDQHRKPPSQQPPPMPAQLTSFVGREQELAELRRLLSAAAGPRLLTLTGAGGSGKTRLALQLASNLFASYPDGVWLVDLAPLADSSLVLQTVAAALGVAEAPGRSRLTPLVEHLRARAPLLILDNCEHLVEACAHLAVTLLQASPNLRILATSREFLGVPGELAWRVPSLATPNPQRLPSVEKLADYEAVRLLVERAALVWPGFGVREDNASAVARICQQLDGMPLAIELAAARLATLSPEQIASRLDDRFHLLTGGSRTSLRRQQTLRATVDWSYELLSDAERALFRRLSVFVGGWTLEAAESVCSGGEVELASVLEILSQLSRKSLVVAGADASESRYRLLETIRQYGAEKLLESGEVASLRDRHLAWYLALAEKAASELFGPDQGLWLERFEVEYDNLRTALDWSLGDGADAVSALRLGAGLGSFWSQGWAHQAEGRAKLELVLARAGGQPAIRAQVLTQAGSLESYQGNWSKARELHEEGLRLGRELGDARLIYMALLHLSWVAGDLGDLAEAYALKRQALDLARETGYVEVAQIMADLGSLLVRQGKLGEGRALVEDSLAVQRAARNADGVATCLLSLGHIALANGDIARAAVLAAEGLALARESHIRRVVVGLLRLQGDLARAEGDFPTARRRYEEGLDLLESPPGDRLLTMSLLVRSAGLAAATGAAERATRLFGAVHHWHELMGIPVLYQPHQGYERDEAGAKTVLGEEAFARAWAEGRAMGLEESVGYALSWEDDG